MNLWKSFTATQDSNWRRNGGEEIEFFEASVYLRNLCEGVLDIATLVVNTIDVTRRHLTWALGAIWALGWLGLFLEIYRWHHVTSSLHLNPPPPIPGLPLPQPGGFLISVLASSALAPPVCLLLIIWDCIARYRARRARR